MCLMHYSGFLFVFGVRECVCVGGVVWGGGGWGLGVGGGGSGGGGDLPPANIPPHSPVLNSRTDGVLPNVIVRLSPPYSQIMFTK